MMKKNPQNLTPKEQVHKMMDYLKISQHLPNYNHIHVSAIFSTVYYDRNTENFHNTKDKSIIKLNDISYTEKMNTVKKNLIIDCKEKAQQRLINIELANNDLFWCIYDE